MCGEESIKLDQVLMWLWGPRYVCANYQQQVDEKTEKKGNYSQMVFATANDQTFDALQQLTANALYSPSECIRLLPVSGDNYGVAVWRVFVWLCASQTSYIISLTYILTLCTFTIRVVLICKKRASLGLNRQLNWKVPPFGSWKKVAELFRYREQASLQLPWFRRKTAKRPLTDACARERKSIV